MAPLYIVIGGVVLLVLLIIVAYNNLVGARNQVENAFGSIDVMLKKRYDLIPNLVETVKAYMKHEKETLTSITELRTRAVSGTLSTEERVEVENKMAGLMRNVMITAENYPELKADSQFTMLQRSWNEAEEQISAARRAYNAAVTSYNNACEKFPSNILASMFGHKRKAVFVIPEVERQNISAKAMFGN
ncbi:MAG TPA: LemA family protein [Cyclobacteriaceae bacterium]|nr:LemA family protein [Cyclobacteriaceae bacterium]